MSKNKIFIVNGRPGSGKTTFARLSEMFVEVTSYSSIDKVKEIAIMCGWSGEKTEEDRKFLSDLKALTTSYSELAFTEVYNKTLEFRSKNSNDTVNRVLLIDIREPDEIRKLLNFIDAETIFIVNPFTPEVTSNESDANVHNYKYDHYIVNDGNFSEFSETVSEFYEKVFSED